MNHKFFNIIRYSFTLALLILWSSSVVAHDLGRRKLSSSFDLPPAGSSVPVAFFDADSTLRVSISGNVSASHAKDVYLLPCVAERLRELKENGYLIMIVSNQGGIPRYTSLEEADLALQYTVDLIREAGGDVAIYDFAENNDEYRKPNTGMAQGLEALLLERNIMIDKNRSFMIGDSAYKKNVDIRPDGIPGTHFSNADRLFAQNYFNFARDEKPAYRFEEAAVFFGWRQNGIDVFQAEGEQSGKAQVEAYLERFSGNLACPQPQSDLF
jgi:DNA 3'-phosphatase